MKKSRFSEEQIVRVLKELEVGGKPKEVCRRLGISDQTLYSWRKRFGQLQPADARRLRALEAENARLKRLLTERDLDISVLKEINAKKW